MAHSKRPGTSGSVEIEDSDSLEKQTGNDSNDRRLVLLEWMFMVRDGRWPMSYARTGRDPSGDSGWVRGAGIPVDSKRMARCLSFSLFRRETQVFLQAVVLGPAKDSLSLNIHARPRLIST